MKKVFLFFSPKSIDFARNCGIMIVETNKGDKQMGKVLEYGIAVVSMAFLLWIGISFVDVVVDNTTTAQHANWNAFVVMTELAK